MELSNEPTHLDLFSGIGGFALAAKWAGFRTIGFVEVDSYASAVLAKHWPNIPNFGDITAINTRTILQTLGCPDVLTAGVPCQPVSLRGKRSGESDKRWLWPDAIRLLRELQPSNAVFENPPGLLSLESGRTFESILCRIMEAGYDCWWETIPASCVGAPHQRDRVWILAHSYRKRYARQRSQEQKIEHQTQPFLLHNWPPGPGAQSTIPREVNGLPGQLDRVRCLGNAVVPQVAFEILKAIRALI